MTTEIEAGWGQPKAEPKLLEEDLFSWRQGVEEAQAYAADNGGQSKTEAAKRFGLAPGTFSDWYNGVYKGDVAAVTARVRAGISGENERRAARASLLDEPGWLPLPTAKQIQDALIYAQAAPAMVLVSLGPGMGKTETAKNFCATRANAFRVVMRPSTHKVHAMLREIAAHLSIQNTIPALLTRFVADKLRRNGRHTLLIIDEAQHLAEQAVNELRYLLDEAGCGIALLGNEDVHARFGGVSPREGYGQLHRRIGLRLRKLKPTEADINQYVQAWKLNDPEAEKLLRAIGHKPGALGQIKGTLQLASIAAMGSGGKVTAELIKQAWANRANEEVRA